MLSRHWKILPAAMVLLMQQAYAQVPDIVIGAPNSLSGGYAEGGRQAVAGLKIAIDEINAKGGIKSLNGARLKLVSADTSSDNPSQAALVTRRLLQQDKAVMLMGAHVSTMTISAQIEAERAEVPIVTTSYADAIVNKGMKYTFKIPPMSSAFSEASFTYINALYSEMKNQQIKRVAIFYGSDANSQALGAGLIANAKKHNIEVVATAALASGITDPTPVIGPVLNGKPEIIFLNLYTDDTILITKALRNLGVKAPIVGSGSGIAVKTIAEALGKQADNLMGTIAWNGDLPIKGVAEFAAKWKAAFPEEKLLPQEAAGEGYAIGRLMGETLEKAKSIDPKVLRDTLSTIDTPSVLAGERVQFDARGMNSHAVPLLVTWYDSKLHTIWPKKYQTFKPQLP
ncbi:MAG: ABC transporter substrate-binding protein [Burkholderiaceae bacterium]|nr:ABC transporter substrate-binding protein [Burkholderiaceae bacterium]